MQDWKCMVRMPSNFIQTVWVQAYTYSDAVSVAQSSTGGKCINATPQLNSQSNNSSSDDSDSGGISGGALLFIAVVVFAIAAWKYILLIGVVALMIWALMKWCQSMDDLN